MGAQEQALVEARAAKKSNRLQLLRLLNPPAPDLWQREIDIYRLDGSLLERRVGCRPGARAGGLGPQV